MTPNPLVLDVSALEALARAGAASLAVAELLDAVREEFLLSGEGVLLSVLVAEWTYETVKGSLRDDEPARFALAKLVKDGPVTVLALLARQADKARALAAHLHVPLGSTAAYVLTENTGGELATYDPAAALAVLPGVQINDLGRSGDEPAVWEI